MLQQSEHTDSIVKKKEIKVGQVWMTCFGIVQITHLHGGYTDCPFQVRMAGMRHNWAMGYDELEYLISN